MLSQLTLEADQAEDGDLHVWEIFGMRIRADQVALSACSTGLGSGSYSDFPVEDDAFGLVRSLLFAGAGTVLATLWDVDDRSTPRLIEKFYERRNRLGGARSLAVAQRAMLHEPGPYRHPRFWAGLAIFAYVDEIHEENLKSGPFQ